MKIYMDGNYVPASSWSHGLNEYWYCGNVFSLQLESGWHIMAVEGFDSGWPRHFIGSFSVEGHAYNTDTTEDWRFTDAAPAGGWHLFNYDDSGWRTASSFTLCDASMWTSWGWPPSFLAQDPNRHPRYVWPSDCASNANGINSWYRIKFYVAGPNAVRTGKYSWYCKAGAINVNGVCQACGAGQFANQGGAINRICY